MVALQISFRSPGWTFKLLSCYALNPVMPQRSSPKAWAFYWSVWLNDGQRSLWKLCWKEKTSGCNLLVFLWHLPTGKGFIWPSVAPPPARMPRGAGENLPAAPALALLPAHPAPALGWGGCSLPFLWSLPLNDFCVGSVHPIRQLQLSHRPQGIPRKSQSPPLAS